MNRSREIIIFLIHQLKKLNQLKPILFRKIKRSRKCFFQMQHCSVEIKVVLSILSAIAAKVNFEAAYCFKVFNPKHFVKKRK